MAAPPAPPVYTPLDDAAPEPAPTAEEEHEAYWREELRPYPDLRDAEGAPRPSAGDPLRPEEIEAYLRMAKEATPEQLAAFARGVRLPGGDLARSVWWPSCQSSGGGSARFCS